ncbi:cytochrome P450 [Nadsonia fulvescens var. elongata DSM 6958]|uniref:Cytochrome P450 n=1 Tax=Nadsonia fulvescens var. elongata DSM 6958 TaxID=857566 RepID=A0A1E3PCY6_9ASCO|nr:cytochrome P450 [Nadsonia fulvescens var. elongata DSM 6958]
MHPLLGKRIFTLDGQGWQHSRAMLKPQFVREQESHVKSLEKYTQIRLDIIRRDNSANPTKGFDIEKLFFKLTIDTSTEFLFGELANTWRELRSVGGDKVEDDFSEAFTVSQNLCVKRLENQIYYYYNNEDFKKARKVVHNYADKIINNVFELYNSGRLYSEYKTFSYVFLYELVKETRDPIVLRDQRLSILIAGRDTTAILISWVIYSLALDPQTWSKLRQEVGKTFGPGPETISAKYLQYVLEEALRPYPPVPMNICVTSRDATLPFGGWEYLPFNGGPRICLGQQHALTEAGYFLARICQQFSDLSSCQSNYASPARRIYFLKIKIILG